MHRSLAVAFWIGIGLLAPEVALGGDAYLKLGAPREAAEVRMPQVKESPEAPKLDLVFGTRDGGATPITVPQEGLLVDPSPGGRIRYPTYALAAPAEGHLVGAEASASLQIEAQVAVTWSAGAAPEYFDVLLTAVPSETVPGELDVRIEGWRSDVKRRSDTPAFFATVSGTLESR